MNNRLLKDILTVWFLILLPIGIVSSAFKACSAFYTQVINKDERSIQLRVTPDMFRPCEDFDRSRPYCGLRKAVVPTLPEVESV